MARIRGLDKKQAGLFTRLVYWMTKRRAGRLILPVQVTAHHTLLLRATGEVLRYASAITQTPVAVADDLFEDLRSHFNEKQLVELTSAIAWENYRARFNHAFEIEAEGFSEGAFCPMPERSTPEAYGSATG